MVDPLKLFWVITNSTYLGRFLSSVLRDRNFWKRKGKLDESYRISDNVIKDLPACEQEKGKVFHGRDARNSRGGSSEFSFQTSIGKNSRDDSFPAKTNHSPLALRSNETNRNEGRYVGKNDEGFSTRR